MEKLFLINDIVNLCAGFRAAGRITGFVPTMGNLHQGHLSLVERAKAEADEVVVSIFVNPLQFGANEDLSTYPRTLDQDLEKLERAGVSAVFIPSESEIYPRSREELTFVEVPGLSGILEGACRPGHFRGVTTVVSKLFNIVQPDVAIFGEKDFQQLMVVRRMVADLNMPIKIIGMPTKRDADGMAMSSRNQYLGTEERDRASELYACLQQLQQAILAGVENSASSIEKALSRLRQSGFEPEYLEIRDADTLAAVGPETRNRVILVAARLGRTRLIDNLRI